MKTLVITEVDGVLDLAPRAAAVAKQALVKPDWSLVVMTARPSSMANETLQYLAARIKISQFPKTSPTYWCCGLTAQDTVSNKQKYFKSLLRQHHNIDRIVVFETNKDVLEAYRGVLAGRQHPRSWVLWLVGPTSVPKVFYSSAVYEKDQGEI